MPIRTCIIVLGFSLFLSACNRDKLSSTIEIAPNIPLSTDTFEITSKEHDANPYKSESFDDFIYHFVNNASFQKAQIQFPLPVTQYGESCTINEAEWTFNDTMRHQFSYTMLFSSKKNIETEKDTMLRRVEVDFVYLYADSVRKYAFGKIENEWKLQSITVDRFSRMRHGDFYQFFSQFATDTVFQYQHIRNPFRFKTEDDYSHEVISGIVNAEAWPEYSPDLPTEVLTCVLYENEYSKTNKRYLVVSNLSAGLSTTLTFERYRKQWRLTDLEYN